MIKIKRIRPLFTSVITTMDKYENDEMTEGGVILGSTKKGTVKEFQKVVAVGDAVRNIKVGDLVAVNPKRYAVLKNDPNSVKNDIEGGNSILGYHFNVMEIDDKQCLVLDDRDIDYVVEEWEETNNPVSKKVIAPPNDIIV